MADRSSKTGKAAEETAYLFLQKQGLRPLARNWRNRCGEIDLIMQDNDDVVFVEVRERNNIHYGSAIESVDYRKRGTLLKTSQAWLCLQNKTSHPVRYDIVGISGGKLEWIKNAFDADN